jgi:hypothetical protein
MAMTPSQWRYAEPRRALPHECPVGGAFCLSIGGQWP